MLLTVQDVAEILATSPNAVYRWIEKGGLGGLRASGEYRINVIDLLHWIIDRQVPLGGDVFPFDEDIPAAPRALSAALARGGIQSLDPPDGEASILGKIADTLADRTGEARDRLLAVLAPRRGARFAVWGDRFAIPAPLCPLIVDESVARAYLFHLGPGMALDSAGGGGCQIRSWFWLTSPTVRDHQFLVARLVRALGQPDVAGALDRPETLPEILQACEDRFEAGRLAEAAV